MSKIPLGRPTGIPEKYAPEVLFGISREVARRTFISQPELPFRGEDIWNAWELTWLDITGKPSVGTATIRVPADSANIVESKSLKLYLNSFANSPYASSELLAEVIAGDLGCVTESPVSVIVSPASRSVFEPIGVLPGLCIDNLQPRFVARDVETDLLNCGPGVVAEELHSHLLRSLCPVTRQPDTGSILIRYEGRKIDHESLLQYLVSYRQHCDFHEACVERIFVDLKSRCQPLRLSVYARYNRRGGIDINPFRSDFEQTAENLRLWRQ